jgi:formylglycine-generating enzyme required for sulfatase activity
LIGDVQEWTLDTYANYLPCSDCTNISAISGASRVVRGEYFCDSSNLTSASRNYAQQGPDSRSSFVGFRCARAP